MNDLIYHNDINDFLAALNNAGQRTEEATTLVIHALGDEVMRRAKDNAPEVTGELVASIDIEYGVNAVRVFSGARHAAFVEFGTWSHSLINRRSGTYTIEPRKAGGALRFTGSDGRPVFTRKVEHPGIRPQQYLGRANASVVNEFMQQIANVGVLLLVEP